MELRNNSFPRGWLRHWNRLPRAVLESPSLQVLTNTLPQVLEHSRLVSWYSH